MAVPPAPEAEGEAIGFDSPEEAVRRIDQLLREEEWEALARCYDLEGTLLTRGEIGRWEWFAHGGRPEAFPGPHEPWPHPFPPGSSYLGHEEVAPDRVRVRVRSTWYERGREMEGERVVEMVRDPDGPGWRLCPPAEEVRRAEREWESTPEGRVFGPVRECLDRMVSTGGHMVSYRADPGSFRVTGAEESEEGLTEYSFRVRARRLSEFGAEPGDPETIEGRIVLDEEMGLAFDEEGRVRFSPGHVLHPRFWSRMDHPAVQGEEFEEMVRPDRD